MKLALLILIMTLFGYGIAQKEFTSSNVELWQMYGEILAMIGISSQIHWYQFRSNRHYIKWTVIK